MTTLSAKLESAAAHFERGLADTRVNIRDGLGEPRRVAWSHSTLFDTFVRPIKDHTHNFAAFGGRLGTVGDRAAGTGAGAQTAGGVVAPTAKGLAAGSRQIGAGLGSWVGTLVGLGSSPAACRWDMKAPAWIAAAAGRGEAWGGGLADAAGRGAVQLGAMAALALQAVGILGCGTVGVLVGVAHGVAAGAVRLTEMAGGTLQHGAEVAGQQASKLGRQAKDTADAGGQAAAHAFQRTKEAAGETAAGARRKLDQGVAAAKGAMHRTAATADAVAEEGAAASAGAMHRTAAAAEGAVSSVAAGTAAVAAEAEHGSRRVAENAAEAADTEARRAA